MDLFNILDCPAGLGPIVSLIKNGLIPILQIGVPIILIIFGMLDLGKAVMAGKEDEIKKNQQMLMKRAIAGVAMFFVVTLVTIIMNLFVTSGSGIDGTNDWKDCWEEKYGATFKELEDYEKNQKIKNLPKCTEAQIEQTLRGGTYYEYGTHIEDAAGNYICRIGS